MTIYIKRQWAIKGVLMVVNAQIFKKNGNEELASYEDLRCLREAKMAEKEAPTIGIAELKKRIAVRTSKSSRPRKLGS